MNNINRKPLSLLQVLVDSAVVTLAWMTAYLVRFEILQGAQSNLELEFIKITPFLVMLSLYAFHKNGLYNSQRFPNKFKEIFRVLRANFFAVIGLVILFYFTSERRISRLTIIIYLGISSSLLVCARILVRNFLRHLRKKGLNLRHTLLVGNSSLLQDYVERAFSYKDSGIRFVGWLDSQGLAETHKIPEFTNSYEELRKTITPDLIIIAYSGQDSHKSHEFIAGHYNDLVPIQLLPDLSYSMVGHNVEDFAGIPLLSVNQPSFNSIELFGKRFIDFFGALLGSILISPVLLFISVGVKLSSSGPLLYGQKRVGLNGSDFLMWKFRSMEVADKKQEEVTEWSNKDNPRKTAFGNFLRRTSLDELPQLFNVLLGQMSLVGPRPEQPFFVEKFRHKIPGYMLKHKMKPGMTGWAQVNGWRGDTDLNKRIECDIYYIKHWSIWFDIKILFLTLFKGFINKNAY